MAKRGNGEGSIYPIRNKDGNVKGYRGSYWVHTAKGPKRRYLSGKRREDVRDKLAKALAHRAEGLVFDAGTLTVGEYLDRWLGDMRDTVRTSTHKRYGYAIGAHIKPALGRIKLKDGDSLWYFNLQPTQRLPHHGLFIHPQNFHGHRPDRVWSDAVGYSEFIEARTAE
jgi:integrase